jgi:hypothetical protein
MKIEDMLKDPEKYHDNIRIARTSYNYPNLPINLRSFPLHWIKQIIEWSKEESKNKVNEDTKRQLAMDDWEVVDG